jgi:alkaline phosphatase
MTSLIKVASLILFISISTCANAQKKKYTVANAHSHNDYLSSTPFYKAYNAGFGSIEADVFPVNGELLVAHHKEEVKPQQTLKALYITPLMEQLAKDPLRRVNLLVDIKEDYGVVLPLLIKDLEPLKPFLSTPKAPNRVTILISGTRPPPIDYKNYPDFILFDNDLKATHSRDEWSRVGLVSLPFYNISRWKGESEISGSDKKAVRHIIDSVHSAGKAIRFWAAPDTKNSWSLQRKLGADFIGTDKIDELAAFLRRKK